MTVEADVTGRRYREDRDTVAVVEGSKEREVELHRALDDDARRRRRARRGGSRTPPGWRRRPRGDPARGPERLRGPRPRDAATRSAPPSRPAARGCSTATRTPTTTAPSSRSRASRARWRRRVLAGAREAIARIDLTAPRGRAPARRRVDVAPIVYLDDADRGAACAEALVLADALGREGLPVYLYGALAGGRTRAELRRGGPEALIARTAPDYGPPRLHPTAGAVLVAARAPLVAFNVELAPPATLEDARAIAALIREGGPEGLPGRAGDRRPARPRRAGLHQRRGPPRRDARRRGRGGAPPRRRWRPRSWSRSRRRRRSRTSPRTSRCATARRSRSGSEGLSRGAAPRSRARARRTVEAGGDGAAGEHELDDGVDHGALRLTAGGRGPAEPSRPAPAMPIGHDQRLRCRAAARRAGSSSVAGAARHGASSRPACDKRGGEQRAWEVHGEAPSRAPLAPRLHVAACKRARIASRAAMEFRILGPLEVRAGGSGGAAARREAARRARDAAPARQPARRRRPDRAGAVGRGRAGGRGQHGAGPRLAAAQGARRRRRARDHGGRLRAAGRARAARRATGFAAGARARGARSSRPAAPRGGGGARATRSRSGAGRRSPTSPTRRSPSRERARLEELRVAALEELRRGAARARPPRGGGRRSSTR